MNMLSKIYRSIGPLPDATQRALLELQLPIVLAIGMLLMGSNWLHSSSVSGWLLAELSMLAALGAMWRLRRHLPVWLAQAAMLLFVFSAMWSGASGGDAMVVIVAGVIALLVIGMSSGRAMACVATLLSAGSLTGALLLFPDVRLGTTLSLLMCAALTAVVSIVHLRLQAQSQHDASKHAGFLLNERERALADFRQRNDGFRRLLEREAEQKSLQLQRANRELREANSHLESFNYMVSHDIRASLRILDGLAKVLVEDLHDNRQPAAQQNLGRMQSSIAHMHSMVQELLAMSAVGKAAMQCRKVDLSAMARELVRDLKTAEPHRRVAVDIANEIYVCAQPELIREVLQNLLYNAWKFTARRSDALIKIGVNDEGGNRIYYVSDNGVGFDMSRAAEMFQPFKRLHAEQGFEGTGVGLAAVKRIIESHGGRVWALAEPGQGAKLCFTLGEHTVTRCEEVTRFGRTTSAATARHLC